MAFDETLAQRIRDALARKKNIEEKKMFGGIGFLLHGNMLVGVWKNSLIVRVGPDGYEDALLETQVKEFDITGRPLKGWVLVEPAGVEGVSAAKEWVHRAKTFVGKLPGNSEYRWWLDREGHWWKRIMARTLLTGQAACSRICSLTSRNERER